MHVYCTYIYFHNTSIIFPGSLNSRLPPQNMSCSCWECLEIPWLAQWAGHWSFKRPRCCSGWITTKLFYRVPAESGKFVLSSALQSCFAFQACPAAERLSKAEVLDGRSSTDTCVEWLCKGRLFPLEDMNKTLFSFPLLAVVLCEGLQPLHAVASHAWETFGHQADVLKLRLH